MTWKSTFYLALGLSVAVLLFIENRNNSPLAEESENVSGALEALSFLGELQTYPTGVIPEKAHYAAWQESRDMAEAAPANRAVEPWETMGPHNRGGRTLNLAFNPQNANTMYAGAASGGLWRSYIGGVGVLAWERVETGFPVLGVSIITFMPGDSMQMFIGTGEVYNYLAAGTGAAYRRTRGSVGIGILRSTDGGQTWEKSLDFSYDQNKGVWDIVVAPSDHNIVYAATTDGVYKSTDGGDTWNWVLDVVQATDLVVHPADPNKVVVACGNFQSPGYGIYRTTDGGTFWYKISNGLPTGYKGKTQLAMAPSNPDILYASIGNGFSSADGASWLCRSTDFGATWTLKNTTDYSKWQGWYSHDVVVHPQNPGEIIVIGIDVWKSTDGGNTLVQTSTGGVGFANPPIEGPDGNADYVHSDCHDVIYHPTNSDILYVASDGGIHRSLDGGETFASCNGSYQTAQFYNGFSNSWQNEVICMGGLQDNGTIQWNGDVTWTRVFGGDGSWSAINTIDDDIRYASWQSLNMVRTTNGGSFSSLATAKQGPISFIAPYVLSPSEPNVLYAGSSVVARSDNGGDNWFLTNGGNQLDGNPVLSMTISYQNSDVVYAATAPYQGNRSGVYVTQNGGTTWTDITGSLPDHYPMDMQTDPTDDATAYVAFSGFGTGHVFRTTDYGATWEDISADLPDVPTNAVEVDPLFPNNVYVGNDLGVFVSVDYGETWEAYRDGLPEAVMVFDLKVSPANRKLRAATHGIGAFQRDLLEEPFVATKDVTGPQKMDVLVSPNPVHGQAFVNYHLAGVQNVRVKVVDLSGQVVRVLFDGKQSKGEQSLALDASYLPQGTYFVNVNAGARVGVSKFLVVE
ncbi:MAG: T9SS type A sorting domain-containing protein [Saprospiraceae bacterium]